MRRFEQWQSQPPFTLPEVFATRLRADRLDQHDLRKLLDESDESLQARCTECADWLDALRESFGLASASPDDRGQDLHSFLNLVRPLIVRGYRQLKAMVLELQSSHDALPFDRAAIENQLLDVLGERLLRILGPTLILELNVARLEDRLAGETPAERFASFVRSLLEPQTARALFREYPVAARRAAECIAQWVEVSGELLRRLCEDAAALQTRFGADQPLGRVTHLAGFAGDGHRRGRSVAIVTFASGRRLAYKPRSLAVEARFQQLLQWLNQRGAAPRFRALEVLDRGTHGWVEFVDRTSCESVEQLHRFYQRQGALAALLYALEANDFHSENLVAAGEHPIPVDLETLFQPLASPHHDDPLAAAYEAAVGRSVLRTGLLPSLAWGDRESAGVDISGIGGQGGQVSPDPVRRWSGLGTDRMTIERAPITLPADRNQPLLRGQPVDPASYGADIEQGFVQTYRLLESHRDELLDANGPLRAFARDEVRVVLRDTRTYAILLRESYHPDLMRDALDRDRHLDRLWTRTVRQPELSRVVPFERLDLQQGDIPIFTARPDSRDLWTSHGDRLSGYFQQTGLDVVQVRLRGFGDEDLARQLWLLRGSLCQLTRAERAPPSLPERIDALAQIEPREVEGRADAEPDAESVDECASHSSVDRFLAEAESIGDQLLARSIQAGRRLLWTGVHPRGGAWALGPTGTDLYSGLPGIALFYAYLGVATRHQRWTQTAERSLATIVDLLDGSRPGVTTIGAFSGWGGIVYALTHLGTLLNRPELLDRAEQIVGRLPSLIDQDCELDLISGSAGCLSALLALWACRPSPVVCDAAERCGERLVAGAHRVDGIATWSTNGVAERPLTGMSHGAAGIAWALDGLAHATGDDRFRIVAREGLAFERSVYGAEQRNWPDYRKSPVTSGSVPSGSVPSGQADRYAVTWCHGAPGIGLARLRMFEREACPREREVLLGELRAALSTTVEQGFGFNHGLCHGDLGNVELLEAASRALGDVALGHRAVRIAERLVDHAAKGGWRCGVPLSISTPGLMTGLSGIGYQLLRMARPDQVPSVLTLEAPRAATSPARL